MEIAVVVFVLLAGFHFQLNFVAKVVEFFRRNSVVFRSPTKRRRSEGEQAMIRGIGPVEGYLRPADGQWHDQQY